MRHSAATQNHGPVNDSGGPSLSYLSFLGAYSASISRQRWNWFFLILALNLMLVGLLVVMDRKYGVDYWNLVRDPNAIAGQPAYYGFYSNIGILLWAAAASTALLGAACLRQRGSADPRMLPLLLGGLFCALACVDDFFMLHEHGYLVKIPEIVTMAAYALFLLAFAAAALPIAHLGNWVLLAAALAFLAISTLVDVADLTRAGSVLIEEGFKLGGIAFLASYLVSLSFSALSERPELDRP